MARPEFGIKRLCVNCRAKFYDLRKDPSPTPVHPTNCPNDPTCGGAPTVDEQKVHPRSVLASFKVAHNLRAETLPNRALRLVSVRPQKYTSPAGGLAAGWFSLYRIQRPIHRLGGKQVLVGDMDDPLR